MSDILMSSSILLAILIALLGFYYPSINKIIETEPFKHKEDNIKLYKEGRNIKYSKLLPITLLSLFITLIFLPELINQIIENFTLIKNNGIFCCRYDTVKATIIMVCIFFIIYSLVLLKLCCTFNSKLNKLSPY